ncbi:MAG: hypothetical protein GF344_01505 [Chitinivibrionales bacterium]|nr:hypothetical protein [Chitinivibrionales bacterium]
MTQVCLMGDVAFTGILCSEPELNKARFREICPILQAADMVFANLEVPVRVDRSVNEEKNFIFYSNRETTRDLISMLNIGCVSLANNHIFDCKHNGLRATIELLNDMGVAHTGAGWKKTHIEPVILKLGDSKIGFLAYVDKRTNPCTERYAGVFVNYFEPQRCAEEVRQLKKCVDTVICSIHWGVDYSIFPTPNQRTVAFDLVEAGVDILMGHHPHTLQPYEQYKGAFIYYSLGGLVFGDYIIRGKMRALFRRTKKSVVVQHRLSKGTISFCATRELKGNYIRLASRDYSKWSKRAWHLFGLKVKTPIAAFLFDFYERVISRVFEYFFGYYQNPCVRLVQLSNLRKVARLFRDLKRE